MYNLYTYEKQLLKKLKEQSQETYRKQFKLKRKKELNNLSQNYDNRMKNFIYSMCENPIILNKNANEDIMNKTFNKKKFIFGEYKTEKQRLAQMEAYKNKLKQYDQERKNIDKKRNLLKVINKRDLMLIQPEMKFTSKTKLEKIIDNIKKEDLFKIDLLDSSLLEKIQNNKFSKAKKIKEFYNLIDKEYLNDSDFKKVIKNMNIIEQDALNNKYTFRNYMAWKYYGIITNNDGNLKKNKSKQDVNTKDILQIMGKEENMNKTKNEYDILVKDDFKTHFKGSSQYIEFQELKEKKENNKRFETVRNNYKIDKDKTSLNNSIRLALRNLHKDKSIKKEILAQEKLKAKTSRNIRIIKKFVKKKDLTKENDYYKILSKNNYSIKDLNDSFKRKKLMMNYLMDKEMDKSLSKEFMKKYNSKNFFGDIVNIPKEYDYDIDDKFTEIKKEKNLEEKKKLLVDLIINEKRKLNDDYYYKFVKQFSKNIFGFKRKSRTKRFDDNSDKIENKSNYIIIDGKIYKKNDIIKIGKVIFKKCNYYNKKNDTKESN